MLTISPTAHNSLQQLLDQDEDHVAFRLVVHGDVPGLYRPELFVMRDGNQMQGDTVVDQGDFRMHLDPESAQKADGVKIDMLMTQMGPRLKFDFPSPVWDDPIAANLQTLLDERINPSLMSHGGFAALVGVNEGVAEVIMGGGCQGCAMSAQTLSDGIEAIIKEEIPEIHTIVDGTNHSGGQNPYYKKSNDTDTSKSSRRRAGRKTN